jgi:integration host factor subunit beta
MIFFKQLQFPDGHYLHPSLDIYAQRTNPGAYPMNKSDLIDALSTKENLSEKDASEIINLVFGGFTDTLKKGGRIEIGEFGSFTVREYGAYTGRNPRSGGMVSVSEKKLPFFKVGKELKERVNHG